MPSPGYPAVLVLRRFGFSLNGAVQPLLNSLFVPLRKVFDVFLSIGVPEASRYFARSDVNGVWKENTSPLTMRKM